MLSIVIPALNEEAAIGHLVQYLITHAAPHPVEVIIADGGSTDNTRVVAQQAGATVVLCPTKGRAAQMNYGASKATHSLLYFVHADTRPPVTFANDIVRAVADGYQLGRYRTRFDSNKLMLRINAFFTRFDWTICYGGDQSLFTTKTLFDRIGGFDSKMMIMEEYDLVKRARLQGRYKIFNAYCLVSARKYDTNGWLKVQLANRTIVKMWQRGASQQQMVERYKQMLMYR